MTDVQRATGAGTGSSRSVLGLDAGLGADGIMLLVVLIWAGNNVIVKLALDEIDPVAYVLGRFALVVLLLFPWPRLRGRPMTVRRADIPLIVVGGVTGFALYNLLFTVGLAETTAFSVALLISLGPVFTLMLAALLRIEPVRPIQWMGVTLALIGIGTFVWDKLAQDLPARGDLLSLFSALAWAVYSLAARRLSGRYPATTVTAWAALVGLLAVVPVGIGPALDQDWIGIGIEGWGAMLYSSALSMLVGYSLWSWAIARRGVVRTTPYLYLVPILTGVISLLALDETFGMGKTVGALLVLAGLFLVRRAAPLRRVSPMVTTPRAG